MWKLIFSEATNIGTGCNREPGVGEFSRDLEPSECAWFNVYPKRYMWNGTGIEEVSNIDALVLNEAIASAVAANKANCKLVILAKYSEETQRNAALGLYDYDETFKAEIVDFIARCISIEDSTADGLSSCTTIEQVTGYQYTPYPTE